jgi:hypothetical protein
MDSYTADIYSVDLMNISSTGVTWDPNYGAVPPNNISTISISPTVWTTNNTGTSGQWLINDTSLTAPTSAKIALKGEDADIEINGRSLMQILDGLEQRLGLLKCREDLESDWSELKALGDQYRAMVKNIEEKTQMWNTLKS